MTERKIGYNPWESFEGNWDLFKEAVNNKNTIYMYDGDGIIIDSPSTVFNDFNLKTGLVAKPMEIESWNHLTEVAEKSGLNEELVKSAEQGWYDSEILRSSHRYLYIRPVIKKTLKLSGPDNNFILTSRKPDLKTATEEWMSLKLRNQEHSSLPCHSRKGLLRCYQSSCFLWLRPGYAVSVPQ